MNYEEAIAYMQSAAAAGIKPGLGRISKLLGRLNNPQHRLRAVHVGGTNGKGSVAAMLTAVLSAAGYRVGTFTSPHLHSYTERFRLNGTPIEPALLAGLINDLSPALESLRAEGVIPTEFEIHTALAFLLFAMKAVEIAVVEVGLGGRYDATNVIIPEVVVITNVTVDHTDYLGESIEQIASEKAGLVKPGVPVVTGAQGVPLEVIERECSAKGAPLFVLGRDFYSVVCGRGLSERTLITPGASPTEDENGHAVNVKLKTLDFELLSGQELDIRGWWGGTRGLRIRLLGRHQQRNAACAVAAVQLLAERGWRVSGAAVRDGMAAAVWPGRFEIVQEKPYVVIDGAHNAAGAAALKEALQCYFPGRRMVLLIGMLADKEREAAAATLCPLARAVVVTCPPGSRAGDWRKLAALARLHSPAVYEIGDISAAVSQALALAGPEDTVVITGSLYLVAEARAVFV
ncbi:MAG: folylpolyglutamate synthase/dihydrofolate synthase family protein [Bacillota bacterium]